MKEMHLYVQAHSNTIMVLLMKAQENYDSKQFKSMVNMIATDLNLKLSYRNGI